MRGLGRSWRSRGKGPLNVDQIPRLWPLVPRVAKRGSKRGSKMDQKGSKMALFGHPRPGQKWEQNDPFLTPFLWFWDRFWTIFGVIFGPEVVQILHCSPRFWVKKGSKSDQFWGQKWVKKWAIPGPLFEQVRSGFKHV